MTTLFVQYKQAHDAQGLWLSSHIAGLFTHIPHLCSYCYHSSQKSAATYTWPAVFCPRGLLLCSHCSARTLITCCRQRVRWFEHLINLNSCITQYWMKHLAQCRSALGLWMSPGPSNGIDIVWWVKLASYCDLLVEGNLCWASRRWKIIYPQCSTVLVWWTA